MIVQKRADGRCLVVVQEGRRNFYLVKRQKNHGEAVVKTNGVPNVHPLSRFHGMRGVLKAAKVYFESGVKEPHFCWE